MSSRTVFITGTSSGIGLAAARLFHSEGWNVVATMRAPEKAPSDLTSLDTTSLLIIKCDVTNLSSIESAVAATIERFGRVDWLINNAAFGTVGVFEALPRQQVMDLMNTNFIGLMDVTRVFLPHLRHAASSSSKYSVGIINVTSGAGIWTLPHTSLYCASKFAVEGFTEAISYELASQNVYAKLVIPHGGVTQTSFMQGTQNAASEADPELNAAYSDFTKKIMGVFGKMIAGSSTTSEDVAKTIFEAAADGTDRLRYFIGNDTRGFLKARYGEKGILADEEYVASMRKYFEY
ncbi:hypothetical protein M422DRAFT_276480 [Sphaerobolus stellatus SS14]|uniref:Uncharacterized protein n=1 Tax=Sphaerobolus stellatus (strain SS14) TaxID=990650 RepID=A0A0C9U1W4_SPHS4|nr:hypothetical protein M422DRAFT_276480 [Sphaerobolus stellatus SS14]